MKFDQKDRFCLKMANFIEKQPNRPFLIKNAKNRAKKGVYFPSTTLRVNQVRSAELLLLFYLTSTTLKPRAAQLCMPPRKYLIFAAG